MKKVLIVFAVLLTVLCCFPAAGAENVRDVILQAQTMPIEELAARAIAESNGMTFFGIGNSSRGEIAIENFVKYLQSIDPSYSLDHEWQNPKNNSIFDELSADSMKSIGTFSIAMVQDGNQIESKMVQTGILDTFIPLEWALANGYTVGEYNGLLPILTVNKVFEFNNTGSRDYSNVWNFVAEGEHGLFMDIDSEVVGKNFLFMLTSDEYSEELKDAFDELPEEEKPYFREVIDKVAQDAENLGLGEKGKYGLAWVKLWVESYNAEIDDSSIINLLADSSASDQFGLLVYSKLRSVEESAFLSRNNITVAAYQDDYTGFGGYGYSCYLFVPVNSPLPWTSCALIAYMTEKADGFSAWGSDIGAYTSNPALAEEMEELYHLRTGGNDESGNVEFAAMNDRGLEWWTEEGGLVLEDPEYCAKVSATVGAWIDLLTRYNRQ